ncbi:MAG: DMT family transporter [Pseudomonadota bacterium]
MSPLMLLAGLGIPVMAALNGSLGVRLGNPVLAAAILLAVALLVTAAALVLPTGSLSASRPGGAPASLYAGGLILSFYLLTMTLAAPRIGVGNAVFLVLLGQLLSAAMIDHYGLFGAPTTVLTPRRIAALALMAAGVALARTQPA